MNGILTIFVMGVSGVGKTTVGSAVANAMDVDFIDADDLHPPANKAKMGAGIPLTDEDRWPWLDAVGHAVAHTPSIVACSSLRRRYRERLLALVPSALFIHLDARRQDISHRIGARAHEFMPTSLLESQLATLEPLDADEPGFRVDASLAVPELVRAITAELERSKELSVEA